VTMQYSTVVRNAGLDARETAIGVSPILKLRTGAVPASPQAADSGTVVATIALPADWLLAAANGVKAKSGTWEDTAADAAGVIGHFRIYATDGVTCHIQGTVSLTGAGGDMTVDNTNVNAGQDVLINSFAITAGNA
jgi:hypothetical protein